MSGRACFSLRSVFVPNFNSSPFFNFNWQDGTQEEEKSDEASSAEASSEEGHSSFPEDPSKRFTRLDVKYCIHYITCYLFDRFFAVALSPSSMLSH